VSAYILPLVQNVSAYQGTTVYLYDTIVNSSQAPLSLANLSLQYGTHGFRIDSVSAKTVEGSSRAIVRIAYTPTNMPVSSETLLLGNISTVLNGTMLTNAAVNDATSNATATLTVDGRELKTSLTDAVHVDLYTSNGATALSAEIPAKGQLDVTSLAAGVYFYRLTHSGKTETGRIVIP
jgi:hypothetical protein